MTKVAVTIADRDRTAVIAARRITLEACKLRLAAGRLGLQIKLHRDTGAIKGIEIDDLATGTGGVGVW